jgi:hypothetical protein
LSFVDFKHKKKLLYIVRKRQLPKRRTRTSAWNAWPNGKRNFLARDRWSTFSMGSNPHSGSLAYLMALLKRLGYK